MKYESKPPNPRRSGVSPRTLKRSSLLLILATSWILGAGSGTALRAEGYGVGSSSNTRIATTLAVNPKCPVYRD